MVFKSKNINKTTQYYTPISYFQQFISRSFLFKCIVLAISLWGVFIFGWYIISFLDSSVQKVNQWATQVISKTLWVPMQKDEMWQINIMLLGHGGGKHRGAYLADTIMIMSFNPDLWAITMLSIPRDLYIKQWTWDFGRINWLFEQSYYMSGDINEAAHIMMAKLTQITGVPLQYYAIVNFEWFEKLIDTLGWIKIDIPSKLVDTTYPKDEYNIMTISFEKGLQVLDGKKALQYARSRHTTSDFSRSYRQQQVIQAMLHTLTSMSNIVNPSTLSQLYTTLTTYIHTNITFQEILGMGVYIYKPRQIFSYVYSADCDNMSYEMVNPWCLLYSPDKNQFGWAAILLPVWASRSNIQQYDSMQNFANTVVYNQAFLLEHPKINILNGIDKSTIKWYNINGITNRLAATLKIQWFDILDIGNSEEKINQTTIFIHTNDSYLQTSNVLSTLIWSFVTKYQPSQSTGIVENSGFDMTIILGNDFVEKAIEQKL